MNRTVNKISTFNPSGKDQILLAEGYLPTDKITKIDRYLRYFGFLSQSIEDYVQSDARGKLEKPANKMYGYILMLFMWLVFSRNVLLAFIEDPYLRKYLGETMPQRPAKQFTMALTIWSGYAALLSRLYYRAEKYRFNSWVTPFLVFKGFLSPQSMGLDSPMTDRWFIKTKKRLRNGLVMLNVRWVIGSALFAWVAYMRYSSRSIPDAFNMLWTILLTIWLYYSSALTYITYAYFRSLCFYFRMRYNKVNNDIESIIDPNNRMKPNERCSTLHHVLIEHNELCMRITDYNTFWSNYLLYSYFLIVALICYTTFQAFFTYNLIVVRTMMFILALECAFLITKISVSASLLANEVRTISKHSSND